MKCPFCGFDQDKVVDSRESKEGGSIRRRRECLRCEKRYTTYERIEEGWTPGEIRAPEGAQRAAPRL
jgi:transcriptional regulator NrdR family protein